MKVTPTKKKFGKYKPGDVFDFPDKAAKVFIKIGKLEQVHAAAPTYQTRMMTAEPVVAVSPLMTFQERTTHIKNPVSESVTVEAPYGYKADGTPRKRPGRPVSAE